MILASVAQDILRAVLQGMPPGTVYALIALGFVLTYKTSGVFNLAFGAQAYISAAMYFQARNEWGWEALPAFVLSVLLLAPALGLLLERLVFRHLRTASAISKLVVTIGLSVALPNLFELAIGFEPVAGRTPEGLVPKGNGPPFYDPFGVYGWSRNELTQMAVALLAIAVLGAIFRFTALGLAMRAVVESPRMTELAGVRADRVSAFAWALSSLFAGLAGVLIAPRFNTLEDIAFFELMVIGIAAAAIGLLVSMPRAMLGGLAIGIVIALSNTFLPRWADGRDWLQPLVDNFTLALPFLVLFGILVFSPRIRASTEAADPLAGVDPPPPQSAALTRSTVLTLATRVFALLVLTVGGWWVFTQADTSWIFLVTQGVIMSIIFLSITVMTGMAGQISLCQGTFAAIGAFSVYQLAERWDVSVLAGALVGAAIAAVVGSLLSLPVRRLGGVWLAVATLAFAFFFDAVMVRQTWVGAASLLQGTRVPRATLGPLDFASDKSFLVLCIVVLVITSVVVIQLREGTIGRTLRALRGSELAAQSIGINPARARLIAFATSAFIAGLGGALLAVQQKNVNYDQNFAPLAAMFWLVLVVSLSARTVEGAIFAGASFSLFERSILRNIFGLSGKWRFVLFGLTSIQYARHPEGLLEYGKRRSTAKMQARIDRLGSDDDQDLDEGADRSAPEVSP